MQDYRIAYVKATFPYWSVTHEDGVEFAMSPNQAMACVGELVRKGVENGKGGEFRIFWDRVPVGFTAPDINLTLDDAPQSFLN
jgi:hypothetical protein